MITNIHEAKTHFSRLVERAENGEEIIIARAGEPVAKLVGFKPSAADRTPGAWKGQIRIASDFDDTPDALIGLFSRKSE